MRPTSQRYNETNDNQTIKQLNKQTKKTKTNYKQSNNNDEGVLTKVGASASNNPTSPSLSTEASTTRQHKKFFALYSTSRNGVLLKYGSKEGTRLTKNKYRRNKPPTNSTKNYNKNEMCYAKKTVYPNKIDNQTKFNSTI